MGPVSKLLRDRAGRTGIFFAGGRFLLAEREPDGFPAAGALFFVLVDLREDVFFVAVAFFLAATFLVPTFFELGFFELGFFDAAFLAVFFLLTAFFFATFFLLTFFFAVFLPEAAFLLLDAVAFFLVTLRFLGAALPAAALRGADFFLAVVDVFRCLLAVFFAGIFYSWRTEKRRGLYMACAGMEARFQPVFSHLLRDCRFVTTIVLLT
jgi:hypothetical protein